MPLEIVYPFDEEVTRVFRLAIENQITQRENIDDVLVGGYSLGARRAQLFNREVWALDAIVVFSIWCYWPLKPRLLPEHQAVLMDRRVPLFADFAAGNTGPLQEAVPEATLLLPLDTLYERQQAGGTLVLLGLG
jgi:predicted alpha/beta-hydrolase family hydrolase